MNPPVLPAAPVAKSQRRLARWVLAGLLLLIAPIVVVGVGVASMFRLSGDAAALRQEVMAATDAQWSTQVQVSAGWCTLATARTVLRFIEHKDMDDARLALGAVRRASVGVYQRAGRAGKWSREQMMVATDENMSRRGWSRLVGVTEDNQAVLVYVSNDLNSSDRVDLCVAVVDDGEMVVVSTRVDADKLIELAEKHLPEGGLRAKLRHAKI